VRYLVPLGALTGIALGFLLVGRYRPLSPRLGTVLRVVTVLPLVASGTLHLLRPMLFVPLVPPPFPPQAWLIVVTGLAELLGGAGLWSPATRRTAAVCLALLMIAIFPANIYIAGQRVAGITMPGVPVRFTMQAVYLVLLLVAGWGLPTRRARPGARG
jgi:uncharacterized membrane protein